MGENEANETYNYTERVEERLTALGITPRPRPKIEDGHKEIYPGMKNGEYFDGRMPTSLKDLELDDLSTLFTLFSNWYAYVRYQTSLCAARKSEAKRKQEFMKAFCRNFYEGESEQAKRDKAKEDSRFIEADAFFEEISAMHEILDAQRSITARDIEIISRQITIRQLQIEANLKQRGFNNRANKAARRSVQENPVGGFDDSGKGKGNGVPDKAKKAVKKRGPRLPRTRDPRAG
jgi:hypothetical protein